MMFLEIGRPRPVPARRVVKYGSKMCGMSSGAIPMPRSLDRDDHVAVAVAAGPHDHAGPVLLEVPRHAPRGARW